MATTIPLPLGSYVLVDPRASCKRLIGCYGETLDQDSPADYKSKANPATLRRMAGIKTIPGFSDGSGRPVRGMWEMAGVQYVVIGPNFYSVAFNPITFTAVLTRLNGTIPITGNTFVRQADNGACLVILDPGTSSAWTYSIGGGFQVLADPFFISRGARDVWFVDSFIVFLSNVPPSNGGYGTLTFFNDDGRTTSGNFQITFTTQASFSREFGTDPFIGGAVDHREIIIIGARTAEGFLNAGNSPGTPFGSAPDSFMEIGCHKLAAYSVAKQDQSIFWVANDSTVRRRNGQTPTRVSNAGIEIILATSNLTGCYALTPTINSHPMWILTMPNAQSPDGYTGRTIGYDCLTQKWFELESFNQGSWRPLCYYNGFGDLQLMGDALSDVTGALDQNTFTEYGAIQRCEFTSQSIYDGHNRITHRRIEVIATVGLGPGVTTPFNTNRRLLEAGGFRLLETGSGPSSPSGAVRLLESSTSGTFQALYAPRLDMFVSDDGGHTFESFSDPQTLGTQSQFDQRTVWFNLGQTRDRVYKWRVTDQTPLFTVDIQATLEGGKW